MSMKTASSHGITKVWRPEARECGLTDAFTATKELTEVSDHGDGSGNTGDDFHSPVADLIREGVPVTPRHGDDSLVTQ